MLTPLFPANAAKPAAPYSPAIDCGDFIFCSGQIALTPSGDMNNASLNDELTQIFYNLDALIVAANCQKTNIAKVTIFMVDLNEYAEMNARYGEYMNGHAPARTTVQVAKLPLNAKVEIEIILKR